MACTYLEKSFFFIHEGRGSFVHEQSYVNYKQKFSYPSHICKFQGVNVTELCGTTNKNGFHNSVLLSGMF